MDSLQAMLPSFRSRTLTPVSLKSTPLAALNTRSYGFRQKKWRNFNRHIVGHIKVVEAHFSDAFQGYIPDKFGSQGKNAIEQFTLLANSYLYKRMDFYLEVKRNHKAVFLNYPFWQKYEFKNQGLKEKVLQAIREAWLTSFPKIPLPMPVHVDIAREKGTASLADNVPEDVTPAKQTDAIFSVDSVSEDTIPVKQINSFSLVNPVHDDPAPVKPVASQHVVKSSA